MIHILGLGIGITDMRSVEKKYKGDDKRCISDGIPRSFLNK